MSADEPRPSKRARQACDPCRRKKSRCPGEKPECSYCQRLSQQCVYSQSDFGDPRGSTDMVESRLTEQARRLESLEGRIEELLGCLSAKQEPTPTTASLEPRACSITSNETQVDTISTMAAHLYLRCCNYQPLPLFHPEGFVESMASRDQELVLAIQAISLRFTAGPAADGVSLRGHATRARSLVMERVNYGRLEVSSLQTLCLLALYEFSTGNIAQAGLTLNTATYLTQRVSLAGEVLGNIHTETDEKRRCLWSIELLKHLQGDGIQTHRLKSGVLTPFDTRSGLSASHEPVAIPQYPGVTSPQEDLGLFPYTIQLTEVWALAMNYAATRVDPASPPPWFSRSDYSIVTYWHTDFDSRVPLKFRYHANRFHSHSLAELEQRRDFWGPWLFLQFVYLAIPCLLNHPFLLSMRLRSFRHTMPLSFLRQSFEAITACTAWVLHLIDLIEHKGFEVFDPTIGACVVVVATIHLQHSFVEDQDLRDKAKSGYEKCVRFLQTLATRWPHLNNMSHKLHQLRESISRNPENRTWSIDAPLLWELLVYDHASQSPSSTGTLFGRTLLNPSTRPAASRMMTPDAEFPLVGSAGISGHQTVARDLDAYPPDLVTTPPATGFAAALGDPSTLSGEFHGLVGDPLDGIVNENLFLAPESYGRAIEDWWNLASF
ncbi:Zn(II)2Cys6 transcription factor [Aspergillus candidus]|uniref:Putative Zn(II)2Cys6 transcription factor n=1 Tax=Aspergillus candidus TaxID=41067 RepID=A0A2I2FCD0_ASPCN|nr:putative Zn(II)2Cys6 transcription factor [Aspergillus candidus]PLB38272.1 putative Zn(II)2Cys6 transcription factor [Aspergillus candidus]